MVTGKREAVTYSGYCAIICIQELREERRGEFFVIPC